MIFRFGALCLFLIGGTPFLSSACLWDSDTLRDEAKGRPGIVEVITGRFERNPPEYYAIRLDQVTGQLKLDPAGLGLYDDAGVACDRLGRGDEAIEWMAKKVKVLETLDRDSEEFTTHIYRYHANLGTFLVHRWLRDGGAVERLGELRLAIGHIGKAIEINPEAHFGREEFQLVAMKWILQTKELQAKAPGRIPKTTFLGGESYPDPTPVKIKGLNSAKAVQGILGMITLGAGWESVDMFAALFIALENSGDGSLAELAKHRVQELETAGRRSVTGKLMSETLHTFMVEDRETPKRFYAAARKEADEWFAYRESFMMQKFAQGSHPDTDEKFWVGFAYKAKPTRP